VGDSYERDVCAAHAAGLRTAWLIGEQTPGTAAGNCLADLRVRSLQELATFLERSSALAAP
jgi:FMN phosphatase YigB (HAD superfamily)